MLRILISVICLLRVALGAPQFVTFKDGKIGVNFGGYNAEAGLGGLLTGNAAHGGLSASAGTPWGQQAAAGLNGGLNGRATGLAYAGAQANPHVGASAVLGGSTVGDGFAGSEAHSYNKISSKTISSGSAHHHVIPATNAPEHNEGSSVIQKIKPPKKYHLIKPEAPASTEQEVVHSKHLIKNVNKSASHPLPIPKTLIAPGNTETITEGNPNIVSSALQIPIGILRSLQDSLSGLHQSKGYVNY